MFIPNVYVKENHLVMYVKVICGTVLLYRVMARYARCCFTPHQNFGISLMSKVMHYGFIFSIHLGSLPLIVLIYSL